ncbi:hypothetical protein NPIL_296311 [Nephila pilipes]|uniref:Uncharacterized protein n=1 Tax=Nephila pilipes TaxID=299642 RepID=A0A8X6UEP5_NEPPI|nr:hypothetical protein NPIL_296311 [Nephila pilipes]
MHVNNHTHIRHVMLYHIEKRWKAALSFRDRNELFGEKQSVKVNTGKDLAVSNQATLAWNFGHEEVNLWILTTRNFWQLRKRAKV